MAVESNWDVDIFFSEKRMVTFKLWTNTIVYEEYVT